MADPLLPLGQAWNWPGPEGFPYFHLWGCYERRKRAFREQYPEATPAEVEVALGRICREIGL